MSTKTFTPKVLAKSQYNKLTKSDINSILTQTVKSHEVTTQALAKANTQLAIAQQEATKYQRIIEAIKTTLGEISQPSRPVWWWALRNFSKLAQLVRDIIAIAKED